MHDAVPAEEAATGATNSSEQPGTAALPESDPTCPRVEVGGRFAPDWQALDAQTNESDDQRAARSTAESALREELGQVLSADVLVVLAGSGTSYGLSSGPEEGNKTAPGMADLWREASATPEFEAVKDELQPALVLAQNLEHVLSDAQARLALYPEHEDLRAFVQKAEGLVLDMCSFVTDNTDLPTHELFLRKVGRRSTRLHRTQIFTTNYDLAIEIAARRTRFNVIDGFGYGGREFDGNSFDLDYVRRRLGEPLALDPNVLHLLKLHGSVDWDAVDGRVVKSPTVAPHAPVLIYPSAAKYQLSYQQPYLEFMSRFQIALRQPDVGVLVVGFGFNDEHIAAPLEAAVRSNIGLRIAVTSPSLRDADRGPFVDWMDGLIHQGDRRITLLKGTFADLVRYLPDVPQAEERDVHAARMSTGPKRESAL
jgi:hypothetical protein